MNQNFNNQIEHKNLKYVMYIGGNIKPFRLVFDTYEQFEECLYEKIENYLKDTMSRLGRIKIYPASRKKMRILSLASVILEKKITSLDDIANLMNIKIRKEKIPLNTHTSNTFT